MRSILRRITPRRLRQIDPPDVVDVGGALMSAPQVEAVRLEPLEKPPHSSVPLIRQPKLMEFVNCLAESKPEIESVFEPFAQPEVDGRRLHRGAISFTTSPFKCEDKEWPPLDRRYVSTP